MTGLILFGLLIGGSDLAFQGAKKVASNPDTAFGVGSAVWKLFRK